MGKEPTLSAYVLTTNNEKTIKRCLDSLRELDEVLVIDGGSTDRTLEIASKYPNVRIYKNPWPGYAKQRNFAMSKIKTDWFFLIDADMQATPELIKEIKATINSPKYEAYYISYYNLFLDSWPLIGGEWFPGYTPMLFKRSKKLHYSELRKVHEGSPYKGPMGYLKNFMVHHSYSSVNSWIQKMVVYTDLELEQLIKGTKKIFNRYKLKLDVNNPLSVLRFLLWYPFIYFLWVFFWRKGYRSGIPGLIYSLLSSFYIFVTHIKYWDNECEKKKIKPKISEAIQLGFKIKSKYLKK